MKPILKFGMSFLLIFVSCLIPLSISAATLYGVSLNVQNSGDPGTSSLYRIDPITGEGALIGDLGYAVNSIAISPATGIMYGATYYPAGKFNGLLEIDPIAGSVKEIGSFGGSFETIGQLAFNLAGQLFGWHDDGGEDHLVAIDTADGSATFMGSYSYTFGGPVMALDNSGRLVLVNYNTVYVINPSNGFASNRATLSFNAVSARTGGGDFDPATGLLWVPWFDGIASEAWIRVANITPDSEIDGVGYDDYVDIESNIQHLHAVAFDRFNSDSDGDIDSDSDGDGIADSDDFCPETPPGVYVDMEGCSSEQLMDEYCPCDGDWKNHGEYVSCVAHMAEDQFLDGLITLEEKNAVISQRARSDCGKKKK